MAINTGKVVTSGLVAGVVMTIIDFILNSFVVGDQVKAAANAFKPGLGDQMMAMDGKTMATYIIMDLVIGLLLAYTYAAMRPRFGAGAKTAIVGAFVLWVFGTIVWYNYLMIGMMSTGLWLTLAVSYLVGLTISSLVAGALYREDGSVAA